MVSPGSSQVNDSDKIPQPVVFFQMQQVVLHWATGKDMVQSSHVQKNKTKSQWCQRLQMEKPEPIKPIDDDTSGIPSSNF